MRKLWKGLVRIIFWSYERGSWPYDVMVGAILVFVLLTPRSWFHDQARSSEIASTGVQLVSEDAASRTRVYRVDASMLAPEEGSSSPTVELEQAAHDVLGNAVQELRNQTFQIVQIEPGRASDGSVLYYNVTIRR
jgi:hypothetical protein